MTTRSLREIYRCNVLDRDGSTVGMVKEVLFHPSEPRAIGLQVAPVLLAGMVPRPARYLTLTHVRFARKLFVDETAAGTADESVPEPVIAKAEEELCVCLAVDSARDEKACWGAAAERTLGFTWDESVIYYGQQVFTTTGEHLGRIADARFTEEDGSLNVVQVTAGTTSDAALGKRSIPGALVQGYRVQHEGVIVEAAAAELPFEGGAAQSAGKAAAQAAQTLGEAGEVLGEVSHKAAHAAIRGAARATVSAERAVKRATQSPTGKRAGNWWRHTIQDFREAMNDENDD